MPISLGESLNWSIDKILNAPFVATIAKNPIFTALLISFIVMLIILFVFLDTDTGNKSILELTLSAGFWCFGATLCVILLHNRVFLSELNSAGASTKFDKVFAPESTLAPIPSPLVAPPENTQFLINNTLPPM